MNIIKNQMWNRMRDECLTDCLVTYIEIDTFILKKKTHIVFIFSQVD